MHEGFVACALYVYVCAKVSGEAPFHESGCDFEEEEKNMYHTGSNLFVTPAVCFPRRTFCSARERVKQSQ
ncbi:hypothetical protein BaRGS_00037370, partial [Batillaria attramentaria]